MNLISKILISCFLSLIIKCACHAQSKGVTPMHKFFQEFADSTIIMEYSTQSWEPPSYKIISKKSGILNCFTYTAIDSGLTKLYKRKVVKIPDTLRAFLQLKKNNFRNEPADVNIFFNVLDIDHDTSIRIWNDIMKFKPWQLLDDKSYPQCSAVAMDAGYSIMHLITKKEIKTLIYYAPYYYEEQCPGNKNRQGIVSIESIVRKYVPFRK
ncbi:MAG: hypothetical protein EOO93_07955 [Pedobacter sp.]|nr:MAG: hypothetical protein EOO93_07955 [Pedobacter sp.]